MCCELSSLRSSNHKSGMTDPIDENGKFNVNACSKTGLEVVKARSIRQRCCESTFKTEQEAVKAR